MTRSPLTLAASITAALPTAEVVATAPLSTGVSGRFDSALVRLADDTRLVVRASTDDAGAVELAAESIALRALTPGTRALLPFRAPEFHGEAALPDGRVLVSGWIPGYAVEAAQLPGGPGAAMSVGIALAAVHALPVSVVRTVGLPIRTAAQAQELAQAVVERAAQTRRLPVALETRWRGAVDDDALWTFEPTVVLGDTGADSFRFEDRDDVPTVVGVLGWHGLAVGDPAIDLHWLVAAPEASGDVLATYADSAARAPDAHLTHRMRLYAELEFAKWLAHGHELRDDAIVDDAVALLDALVDGLTDTPPLTAEPIAAPDPFGPPLAPASLAAGVGADPSTAMQTDAYDPRALAQYLARDDETGAIATDVEIVTAVDLSEDGMQPTEPLDVAGLRTTDQAAEQTAGQAANQATDQAAAASPVELSTWAREHHASADDADAEGDVARASRAAFQRWASSGSE